MICPTLYIYACSIYIYSRMRPLRLRIGECPSNSPFLNHNGPIVFKEWRDTRTFSNLKSTHCTLLVLLIINLVAKQVCV